MNGSPLAITDILPHRDTMLWQDTVLGHDTQKVTCSYRIPAAAWYLDAQAAMPAWLGIEVMAQAVAAHVALTAIGEGRPAKRGALLGSRDFSSRLAAFPAGSTLRTTALMEFRDDSGLGAYQCAIHIGDECVASATLKVYEPNDFEQFLAAGASAS